MIVKLLTEHHLEFLSLKGGCRGSSESTVHMSKCHIVGNLISFSVDKAPGIETHVLDVTDWDAARTYRSACENAGTACLEPFLDAKNETLYQYIVINQLITKAISMEVNKYINDAFF